MFETTRQAALGTRSVACAASDGPSQVSRGGEVPKGLERGRCLQAAVLMGGISGQGVLISCSSSLPGLSERPEERGPLCRQLPAL